MLLLSRALQTALVVLVFLILAPSAEAFHSKDHIAITRQALKEFQKCYPGMTTKIEFFLLSSSNLEEDFNVIRKDLTYSHYYNPNKILPMLRFDSSVRIQDLEEALKSDDSYSLLLIHLGHAIHHIQDMAVPAHVVPVAHGFQDTFETYQLKNSQISTNMSCLDLEKQALGVQDLFALLNKSANESLLALAEILVPITKINSTGTKNYWVDGSAFWKIAAGNDFGSYGPLGEHFGDSKVEFSKGIVMIPPAFYEQFKKHQLQQAVINSWIALFQFHKPVTTVKGQKVEINTFNPLSLFQIENLKRVASPFYFAYSN